MLEIYINTDSLTPAADIYADAEKSTSLGRRVPFVRGERGKLRVGFLGANAPSEGAQVVLAVRAMDAGKTELLRTEGGSRETVGGVPVYELDFVVDTVELSAALEKAESLTLLAGVVVKEGGDADDAQNEWQFSMVISDTALRGNAPSPSPDPDPEHPSATLDGDNVFTGSNTFTKPVVCESVEISEPGHLATKAYVDGLVFAGNIARFAPADSSSTVGSVHGQYLLASQNGEDGGLVVAGGTSATRSWTKYATRYQRTRVRVYGAPDSEPQDFYFRADEAGEDHGGDVIARLKDIPSPGGTLTVDDGNELKMAGTLRWLDGEGNTAVSMRFTDSPTGGVLNQGSASTTAAMTWMSGNYMSWFSSELLRLYSGESVISPTSKVEVNPNGVILAAGANDATKIVIDSGRIQVSGSPLTLNVAPTAANHAATKAYVDAAIAALEAKIAALEARVASPEGGASA